MGDEMQQNAKMKPKTCGCRMCRRGRGHQTFGIKAEERAARHAAKIELRKGPEEADVLIAHRGTYTD